MAFARIHGRFRHHKQGDAMSFRDPAPDFSGEIVRVSLNRLKQMLDEINRCRAQLGQPNWTGPIGDIEQARVVRCSFDGVITVKAAKVMTPENAGVSAGEDGSLFVEE
jgi:hypothetical protein